MKNIHILPTDQPSRLIIYSTLLNELRLLNEPLNWRIASHIYITSDEEIKEGDWYLDTTVNVIFKNDKLFLNGTGYKKIIISTDIKLIDDGVQAIDDEFLEWFVKNSSCEFVEVKKIKLCIQTGSPCGMQCFSEETCNENIIYKIIIPQEEPKQESLEEEVVSKKNNIIDSWLEEHGDPEIDKKVEEELERMTNKEEPNLENISSKEMPQEFSKLVNENFDELISNESKQGTHYHFIIQNDKYKMLLAMQTYPETKYYFKDDEISVEELILKLDNEQSSEIKYTEDEVRELLIKALTHNDDKLCGSLVTVQKEIRTANFNVWFEEYKKK